MSQPLKTGIIGYGRLGAELAASLEKGIPSLRLAWICDPLEARRNKALEEHISIPQGESFRQAPSDLEAVILCPSPREQGIPAEYFLNKGVHVISAPPLAPSAVGLARLESLSLRGPAHFVPLRRFSKHPAWQAFRDAWPDLEDARLCDIRMASYGPFSSDLSVQRSLAGWVLPEVLALIGRKPLWVSSLGAPALRGGPADIGALSVELEGDFHLMLALSRVSPEEGMKILALGERRILEFYSNQGSFAEARLHSRRAHVEDGVAWTAPEGAPQILRSEEVDAGTAGLLAAIRGLGEDGPESLAADILCEKILDAAWVSARLGGSRVKLDDKLLPGQG